MVPAADNPELDAIIENAPHVFTETFTSTAMCACRWRPVAWSPSGTGGRKSSTWSSPVRGCTVPGLFFSRMVGIPEDDIRVIMGDVGGAFGQKSSPQREDQAVVVAAVLLGTGR